MHTQNTHLSTYFDVFRIFFMQWIYICVESSNKNKRRCNTNVRMILGKELFVECVCMWPRRYSVKLLNKTNIQKPILHMSIKCVFDMNAINSIVCQQGLKHMTSRPSDVKKHRMKEKTKQNISDNNLFERRYEQWQRLRQKIVIYHANLFEMISLIERIKCLS